ncbi:MAG: hypothetical protein WKF77_10275 [Planctomycetaceae bacterium]
MSHSAGGTWRGQVGQLIALVWKVATELLYPLSGAPAWEFIERGGRYIAPLALCIVLSRIAEAESAPDVNP